MSIGLSKDLTGPIFQLI